MPNHDDLTRRLIRWGTQRGDVRAMLLTSTLAVPGARVDSLSDHDVILVVRDIRPYLEDRQWIEDFGEVLVAYWDPVAVDPGTGVEQSGNVVQYAAGHKIDFTLWPTGQLERIASSTSLPDELDAGYRVLIDKDGLADRLATPSYSAYSLRRPDDATYQLNVNDFFVGPPYVAKCILRGDLLPARWCLDYDMKHVYLRPMLEWRAACDHGWSIRIGALGKGLRRYLPADILSALENTYVGGGSEGDWEALFRTMALYGRVAREVGEHLGYRYPGNLDASVSTFVRQMRDWRVEPT